MIDRFGRMAGVFVRSSRVSGADVQRIVAGAGIMGVRRGSCSRTRFVERYVVDLALGLKAAIMLLNCAALSSGWISVGGIG